MRATRVRVIDGSGRGTSYGSSRRPELPKTRSRGRATVLPSDDVSDEPSGPADPTVAPEPVATRASDPAADDPVDDGPVTDDPAEGAATAGAVPSVIAIRAGTAHA